MNMKDGNLGLAASTKSTKCAKPLFFVSFLLVGKTVDDTIRKGKSLQEAACQVILSEGQLIWDNVLLKLAGF